MLRAKAVHFKQHGTSIRNRVLSSTDTVGKLAGIPVVVNTVNAANKMPVFRKALHALGVHQNAKVPKYHSKTLRKSFTPSGVTAKGGENTSGKVAIFATCYGNYNEPMLGDDLRAVFEHNDIEMRLTDKEKCCGMPKLELGDLESVIKAKQVNIPELARLVDEGWDLIAPVPSCVLMFKQELPLMFPDDEQVQKVRDAMYDPFEYLMLRHKDGLLRTDFNKPMGKIAYQVACHQRVQNIGMKTRDVLQLIPDTEVQAIERCSGHDGTYAVKTEFHEVSMKIVRPVVRKVQEMKADYYTSDCAMAGRHIENAMNDGSHTTHPISLLRQAYGI
jgi:Fe-S oxidoreductase